jgi:iron(III) transport system permease protein
MHISRPTLVIIAIAVAALVVAPIAVIVFAAGWSSVPGATGHATLEAFAQVLGAKSTYFALGDTLVYGSLAALLGTTVGIFYAWAVHRTDVPGKKVLNVMAILPLTLPPIVKAVSFILLFDPKIGFLNVVISQAIGAHVAVFNIFTWPGFIYACGIGGTPAAYLILSPAFSNMDPILEESSLATSAGKLYTFVHVTLPILFPAIVSTFFLSIMVDIGIIEYPLLIAQRAGIMTLVGAVDGAMTPTPNFNIASAISVIFLILALSLLTAYLHFTRRAFKYAAIGGRDYAPKLTKLGRAYGYLVLTVGTIIFLFDYGFTWLIMILLSFVRYYQVINDRFVMTFTTSYYANLFKGPIVASSTITSFEISLLVAVTATFTSIFFVLASFRFHFKGGRIFEIIGTLPAAYPGVILSLAFLWVALALPKGLYGSIWVFVLAFTVSWIYVPIRIMSSNIIQIKEELEESSRVAGSGTVGTLGRITFPLIRQAIVNSFLYVFIDSFREVGAALLLITPNLLPLSVLILESYNENAGNLGPIAAESILMCSVMTVVFVIAQKYFGPTTAFGAPVVKE